MYDIRIYVCPLKNVSRSLCSVRVLWQLLRLGDVPDHLPGAFPGAGALSSGGVCADAHLDRPPGHCAAGVPVRHLHHRRRLRHHVRGIM